MFFGNFIEKKFKIAFKLVRNKVFLKQNIPFMVLFFRFALLYFYLFYVFNLNQYVFFFYMNAINLYFCKKGEK